MSSANITEKSAESREYGQKEGAEGPVPASIASSNSFANPTGINERALVRRLDYKLLPPLTLLYLLSFLDRSNST